MGYEWVIRVDTDSEFPEPIPYNIVSAMVQHDALYGYRLWHVEDAKVARGLAEASKYWVVAEGLNPTFLLSQVNPAAMAGLSTEGWNRRIVYNNFFVTKLSWWVQPHIQGWLGFLEHLHGAHKFRWGDAPVHTLTLGMFMPTERMLEFGFSYGHQGKWTLNQFTGPGIFPRLVCRDENCTREFLSGH